MSRWLKNVNALLENLDSQVEDTVEEHRLNQTLVAASRKSGTDGGEVDGVAELLQEEAQELDDILAKRGLLGDEDDEYVDVQKDCDEIDTTEQERLVDVEDEGVNNVVDLPNLQIDRPELPKESYDDKLKQPGDDAKGSGNNPVIKGEGTVDDALALDGNSTEAFKEEEQTQAEVAPTDDKSTGSTVIEPTNAAKEPQLHVPPAPSKQTAPSPSSGLLTVTSAAPAVDNKQLKELRKLRRNVVQLNSDLESAEREIEAQRQELDRAASRMERDRSRHKQEKETHAATHKAELAAMTAAHDKALQQLKEASDNAMKEMEDRVARAEQQRALEGGERDAELADALERERGAVASSARLQEEKITMNERVSSLSSEVSRLETRLEHATSQMELASERERNAEEQLDKSLTIHARQLGVRQKREAELEQTIAELGAALVISKNKIESAIKAGVDLDGSNQRNRSGFQSDAGDSLELTAKLQDAQDEIDTLQVQLGLERQRCSTLHSELQDLSQAQAEEISGAYSKQRQYERKISDLTSLVANLQPRGGSSPGDETGEDFSSSSRRQNSGDENKEADHLRKQIASLTEKVFEQQTKVDHSRSEVSTLKSRLRSAVLRAETAEKSLETANQRLLMDTTLNSGVSSCDEEMGGDITLHRRRAQRRGFHKTSKVESIRSALGLHEGRVPTGGFQEMATSLLDTFDGVAVDLGSHFRHYPISRLAFLLYLALLHVYAFFLLVYHAHAQGTGVDHYGPESMLRLHGHVDPAVVSSAASP